MLMMIQKGMKRAHFIEMFIMISKGLKHLKNCKRI